MNQGFSSSGHGTCEHSKYGFEPKLLTKIDHPELRLMLAPTQIGSAQLGWSRVIVSSARPNVARQKGKEFNWENLVWDALTRWDGKMPATYADGHVGRIGKEKFILGPKAAKGQYCAELRTHPDAVRFRGVP